MVSDDDPPALVLGGAGFIGAHLVRELLRRGRRVRVLDLLGGERAVSIPYHANLEWQEGNFVEAEDRRRALDGVRSVFHLVSTTQPQSSNDNPEFDVRTNLLATIGLLEQMRNMPGVPLVFVSSGGTVYGPPIETPISESHPTNPQCSYGIVKLAIEKYLALYQLLHRVDYRVLRIANPYGPGQVNRNQGVIGAFASRILSGEPVEVWGDGSVIRDFIFVGDACEALIRSEAYHGNERIFNIGSGMGHSVLEIIAAIERAASQKADVRFKPGRSMDVPVSVLDTRLARDELGWSPRVSLDDGLEMTLRWMRENAS